MLIIGSGVFGLSTAWALTKQEKFAATKITVLDRSPEPGQFPAKDAASNDSSRIIRTDYADPAYAALAAEAQVHWRRDGDDDLGGQGRYHQCGLLLGANDGPLIRDDGAATGLAYAKKSWVNAMALAHSQGYPLSSIRMLPRPKNVAGASRTGASFADWAYLNENSGWADAGAAMRWTYDRVVATGRVEFVNGTAERLVTDPDDPAKVTGARLQDGTVLSAELVVVAAGAWTTSLVDMDSQVAATGQVMAYMKLTPEEHARLRDIPVMLNLSTGFFVIPPTKRGILKLGRHAYGYVNPTVVPTPLGGKPDAAPKEEEDGDEDGDDGTTTPTANGAKESAKDGDAPASEPEPEPKSTTTPTTATVSRPFTHMDDPKVRVPHEGEADLRRGLRSTMPWPELQERPFAGTRLCWYTDTATGDWIIDYHPRFKSTLFLATGGSGHGFKFLPVIGDRVAACIAGAYPPEFQEKWRWRAGADVDKVVATEDGSRGGKPGLVLKELFAEQVRLQEERERELKKKEEEEELKEEGQQQKGEQAQAQEQVPAQAAK